MRGRSAPRWYASRKRAGGGGRHDASGRRAGVGAGRGADGGAGGGLRVGPQGGQLIRAESERTLQRRATAVGTHQQAGQFVSALLAGGSGTIGGALRCR